jgi:multidrug efflux pump
MWLSDTSVKRPVFASVISMLLVGFGVLSFQSLQVREYPDIQSPTLSITATYPGASAAVIETQVTQILEDSISGIEGIESLRSSSIDGRSSINIAFDLTRNIDEAANDVRDRVSRSQRALPEELDAITIAKQDSDATPVVFVTVTSENLEPTELRDFVDRFVVDQFSVLPGVSQINVFGPGRPSVRIWLDRLEMAARGLTVTDIEAALRRENLELPAGRVDSVDREFPVRVSRGYTTPEDFQQLVIQRGADGQLIRLAEVALVELGPEDIRSTFLINGQSSVALGITKQSTANTVEVIAGVHETIERLNNDLPEGMIVGTAADSSVFINSAIKSVYQTILITTGLVGLVIYLFLGSYRAMIIPLVTVPVCLISSFIALNALGYSINLITLLALVLAIGLVVDDSIVVLENIHRRIEKGEPPLLAAFKGTRQVGFAVIATTAVVVAVFTPIMFLTDNIGLIFSELAVAVCAAVIFSSVLALSLAPMLCSKLLKPAGHNATWLSRKTDYFFNWLGDRYQDGLTRVLKKSWLAVPLIVFVFFMVGLLFANLPSEYAPQEDQRMFIASTIAPESTSYTKMLSRLPELVAPVLPYAESGDVTGYLQRVPSFFNPAPNAALTVVVLAPLTESDVETTEVMQNLVRQWNQLPDLRTFAFMRQGLSRNSGQQIEFVLQGLNYDELVEWRDIVLLAAEDYPGIARLDSDLKETQSQVIVDIDRDRAAALGVSAQAVGQTLQTMMSEREVSTYVLDGEEYAVMMQAKNEQRASPDDLKNIFVRSSSGQLIPLSNLIEIRNEAGIASLNRYNRLRAVTLSGSVEPGYSLGDALTFLETVADEQLPATAAVDYKGQSLEYKESTSQIWLTFGIAMMVLFFVMAAQFESFVHPLVILVTVPLAIAGALVGLHISGATLNIYSQIGIVMLIGIAAKNGILIVEFINQLRDLGRGFEQSIIEAARIRFRPVLMTTISTVAGSIPLILAVGPGSESRVVLGVVIFSGVSVASVFTLFLVPMVYNLMARNTGSPEAVAHELERLQDAQAAA